MGSYAGNSYAQSYFFGGNSVANAYGGYTVPGTATQTQTTYADGSTVTSPPAYAGYGKAAGGGAGAGSGGGGSGVSMPGGGSGSGGGGSAAGNAMNQLGQILNNLIHPNAQTSATQPGYVMPAATSSFSSMLPMIIIIGAIFFLMSQKGK